MHPATSEINSQSVGDRDRFRTFEQLEQGLASLRTAKDKGVVTMVVARGEGGRREILQHVRLDPDAGIPGDAWGRRAGRKPDTSITVMQTDVAELIANGQPIELSGDNLYLALDLSNANLPTGSRVRAGTATLEVTPYPHNGCKKFLARFGEEAVRFTSNPELRPRNLRGIYMRVVEGGEIRPGDKVEVIARAHQA
jgi:MOSC domain-containing protein YiiM